MKTIIEVIPAILPASYEELDAALLQMEHVAPLVQVDVIDGVYVQNKTWPYTDRVLFIEMLSEEKKHLPPREGFGFEFDLMVKTPLDAVHAFIHQGATRLVLHSDSDALLETLNELQPLCKKKPELQVGIALPSNAVSSDLRRFTGKYSYVQVMGIEHVGYQGQVFDPNVLSLITELRQEFPTLSIQVDGGVSKETLPRLIAAGATRLVVGSAIFKSTDPAAAYKELYALANQ